MIGLWHTHPETGELLSAGVADQSPLEPGVHLIPAHATTIAPPAALAGHAICWRDGAWRHIADHRGETWWRGGEPYTVTTLGNPEGNSIAPPVDPAEQLANAKMVYKTKIDSDAEKVRLRYITPGDGMQMTYREKFEQAQGVNAMGETAANALTQTERQAQFPTLSAGIGIEGATLWAVAQLVLQKYAQFAQLSFVIESTRLGAKKAIGDASSEAAVKAIYEAVTWQTP